MKTRVSLIAAGIFLAAASSALAATHYVDLNSSDPTPPNTNWVSAATNIQDAVDGAVAGDEVVVTNGTYATGGRAVYGTMTNRVAVDRPLTLRSTNLANSMVFTPIATDIPGQPGTTTYIDADTHGVGPFFYRVGVRN